jgi:hypothetical protein
MSHPQDDPVLVSARREALLVFFIWVAALSYTITYCYTQGYNRPLESLTFVFGIPDWVFWGIIVPWMVCLLASWIFSYVLMTDADLGSEIEDAEDRLDV